MPKHLASRYARALVQRLQATTPLKKAPISPSRRAMLAGLLTAPFAATASKALTEEEEFDIDLENLDALSGATPKWTHPSLDDLKGTLPKGKIGDLEISRLVFGSNLIGGYSHSRDLIYVSKLFKAYNTEAKIFETLRLAEDAGIDTMITPSHELPLIQKYHKVAEGAIQTVVQVYPKEDDLTSDIDRSIDQGATTLYIQGGYADKFVEAGQVDLLARALEHIKKQGYLGGVGGHSIEVPIACEKAGLEVDYYVKTCHHDRYWSAHPRENRQEFCVNHPCKADHNEYHDNIFDIFPEKTVEFMETVKKPWIGFKVLAGGAIHPNDGFRYAFESGADFICVGAFDFQVVEDVNIAIRALKRVKDRKRPWCG